MLEIIDIKYSAVCLLYPPDKDQSNFDRVANFVIYLNWITVEISGSQGDFSFNIEGIYPEKPFSLIVPLYAPNRTITQASLGFTTVNPITVDMNSSVTTLPARLSHT